MKFKKSLVVFIFTLISLNVFSEPVYLKCSVTNTETTKFSIKLDEQNAKITHTYADGSAFNADGFFSANAISYQKIQFYGGQTLKTLYEIDRTSLNIVITFHAEPTDPKYRSQIEPVHSVTKGACELEKVSPDRKI